MTTTRNTPTPRITLHKSGVAGRYHVRYGTATGWEALGTVTKSESPWTSTTRPHTVWVAKSSGGSVTATKATRTEAVNYLTNWAFGSSRNR